jgi:hypothetical protein
MARGHPLRHVRVHVRGARAAHGSGVRERSTVCASRGPALCIVRCLPKQPLTIIVIPVQHCLHSLLVDLVEDEKVYMYVWPLDASEPHPRHALVTLLCDSRNLTMGCEYLLSSSL